MWILIVKGFPACTSLSALITVTPLMVPKHCHPSLWCHHRTDSWVRQLLPPVLRNSFIARNRPHLCMYCLWQLHLMTAELNICNRGCVFQSPKLFTTCYVIGKYSEHEVDSLVFNVIKHILPEYLDVDLTYGKYNQKVSRYYPCTIQTLQMKHYYYFHFTVDMIKT